MITDIEQLPDHAVLQADICIVGAGAAGLLIAREFLGTATQVILLESGGLGAEDATQALSAGEVSEGAFRGLQAGRSRVLGGTTTLWGGQCIPLDPIDLAERPWVPFSGWPIGPDELAPFYERAKQHLRIEQDEYDQPVWERFGLGSLVLDRAKLQAVHGVFIRQPDLGRRFREEIRAADNVRVLLHANVRSIETDASGVQVSRVAFCSLGGRRGSVAARRVVLCAGAIENARLLLLSDSKHPNGLGNDRDLVGRFLQDHPCGRTATIETTDPRRLQDRFNLLYGKRANYLPKLALSEAVQREQKVLNCVARLEYEYEADSGMQAVRDLMEAARGRRWPKGLGGTLARLGRGSPALAGDAWRVLAKGLSPAPRPRRIHLEVFSEQTPQPDSRVVLGRGTDALGLRKVLVDWRLDDLTWRTFGVFSRTVRDEFARLGLGEVRLLDWLDAEVPPRSAVVDSYHPAGTTRMARHAAGGVVDINSQVFGVQGLYVTGSSVFPTSGAANPTFTIAAMALRLAARLKSEIATRNVVTVQQWPARAEATGAG
ncbi:FAD-dependent oxidoreductase [Roseomonas elaeocarpi]|uniref:FAD-dependent oxidoreductase n=1 Tax=Roseomonas elaeocarpi TaxID=907779 RepID=A0ABV6JPT9_9PROT